MASLLKNAILSLGLAAIFFYFDLQLPLGFAGGVPYISLILIGLWVESPRLIIINAGLGTVLTILGFFFSPENPDLELAALNRILAVATHWLTAYFCLMNLRLIEEKGRGDLLEQANAQLKLETEYMQLNRDIALVSNLSRSLKDAIGYSLKRICEFTGWPIGHLYLSGENGQILLPSGIWYLENEKKFEIFREITRKSELEPGEGLPGRIMAKGKSQFIVDLKADSNFPRGALSKDINVVSGFGFPILIENTPVGVMEFFSAKPMKPSDRLMEVMENIGNLLGRVVERARIDEEKETFSKHLRSLYHKLDSVREEESRRIAREVHDNLGQVLTTLKIELSLLNEKLNEKSEAVKESVDMMFSLIEKNIRVVKKISKELRPPVLDSMSITEAINWQGILFQEKTGIGFNLTTPSVEIALDTQRSTTLFRIFQECLTNIFRHAEASEVNVDISIDNGFLIMEVRDNGKGIPEEEIQSNASLGLLGMKERAQIWDWDVQIVGEKDVGTSVTIKMEWASET